MALEWNNIVEQLAVVWNNLGGIHSVKQTTGCKTFGFSMAPGYCIIQANFLISTHDSFEGYLANEFDLHYNHATTRWSTGTHEFALGFTDHFYPNRAPAWFRNQPFECYSNIDPTGNPAIGELDERNLRITAGHCYLDIPT